MTVAHPRDSPSRRVFFLSAQAFALGITAAWILIPASAIFLSAYGSDLLPVTYIGAAVAGAASSVMLASAFRRRPVASVAVPVLSALAFILVMAWSLLRYGDGTWVSFALLVFVPILVPVGFVFIVGQAGLLLDVRVLKARYARVVAGFALGFVAGGLGAPLLLAVLSHTADLLLAGALATSLFLGLVLITRRRYAAELTVLDVSSGETEHPTLRSLVRHRFVMLIVAFQMLSAVESQWLDFLVFDRAANRYRASSELARFISQFSAIAYGADILFLVVVAGLLLRRFGLRYGLVANAAGVLAVLATIIGFGVTLGSGATVVFVMIVAARVTDLTFSDGTSRTSLSAAYQAVPGRLRSVAQAAVEGLAVPVAIGVSGVVLLALQTVGGTEGLTLPIMTAVVVVAWIVVAIMLYREYRISLLASLRGRSLDPADLNIDDQSSLLVIDRLVESADERDVRLGLDILTIAQHPELPIRLQRLIADERVIVRTDALERLALLAPHMAAEAARDGLRNPFLTVRAASIRILGATHDPADLPAIAEAVHDQAHEVKVAAAQAITAMGDAEARTMVNAEVTRLVTSGAPDDRVAGAAMVGATEASAVHRNALRRLLADEDPTVVRAALDAVRAPDDVELMGEVFAHLPDRLTGANALHALARFGETALTIVADGMQVEDADRSVLVSLVRLARTVGGPRADALLRRSVNHTDREVGLAVMSALATLGRLQSSNGVHPPSHDPVPSSVEASVLHGDLEHAAHILRALTGFADESHANLQNAALRHELQLVRARVLAALSMRHGVSGMQRVVYQLEQRDPHSHALALEWLDLALDGTDRAAMVVLERSGSDTDRLSALARWFPVGTATQQQLLEDLARDATLRWRRPWISACALHTAAAMTAIDLDAVIAAASERPTPDPDDIVGETVDGLCARRSIDAA